MKGILRSVKDGQHSTLVDLEAAEREVWFELPADIAQFVRVGLYKVPGESETLIALGVREDPGREPQAVALRKSQILAFVYTVLAVAEIMPDTDAVGEDAHQQRGVG